MVHVVVVIMVMMMVMHLVGHRGGRSGFLRDGVAGEADGESGGGDKALDHGHVSFQKKDPLVFAAIYRVLHELKMN
jgi:hypothetical protein